ncbi:MAG: hypothetical protein JXJ04_14510, partial [Spirochaetales bacterium]|nr:hypothetical protein [Spirochaetales bacterium]
MQKKIIIIVCCLTLLFACKELPEPDDITPDLQGDVFLDKSPSHSVYENGQEVTIYWNMTPGISDDVKIELLNGSQVIRVIMRKTANDGVCAWNIYNLIMQDGYRIRITLLDGLFAGKYLESTDFFIREPWLDLGLVSAEDSWGASIVMGNDNKPFVMYQDHNNCITVKHYDGEKWIDLEIEDKNYPFLTNYFSMNLTAAGQLLAVYTKDGDTSIVKRRDPGEKKWQSAPFLTTGQMSFGVYIAEKEPGIPIVSFATLTGNGTTLKGSFDIGDLHKMMIHLRARISNNIIWEDGDPWKDSTYDHNDRLWRDEGNVLHPVYSFGRGIKILDNKYWVQKILYPLYQSLQNATQPFDFPEIITENIKLIKELQMDFHTSIAVDNDGNPYLAYVDGSSLARGIKVCRKNNDNWEDMEGYISEYNSNQVSLAINPVNNYPLVAYKHLDARGSTIVKAFNGEWWQNLEFTGHSIGTYPDSIGTYPDSIGTYPDSIGT